MFRPLVNRTAIHSIVPKQIGTHRVLEEHLLYGTSSRSLITYKTDENKHEETNNFGKTLLASLLVSSITCFGIMHLNREERGCYNSSISDLHICKVNNNERQILEHFESVLKNSNILSDQIDKRIPLLNSDVKKVKPEIKQEVKQEVKPDIHSEVEYDLDILVILIDEQIKSWKENFRDYKTCPKKDEEKYLSLILKNEQILQKNYDILVNKIKKDNIDSYMVTDIISKLKTNLSYFKDKQNTHVQLFKKNTQRAQLKNELFKNEFLENSIKLFQSRIESDEKMISLLESILQERNKNGTMAKTLLATTFIGATCGIGYVIMNSK